MRRKEALIAMACAGLMVSGGATWYLGPLGLIACGLALGVYLSFINIKED